MIKDVWSLGIMLFRMKFGNRPWKVNELNSIKERSMAQILKEKEECSESLKQLLIDMLNPSYFERISLDEIQNSDWLNSEEEENSLFSISHPNNFSEKTQDTDNFTVFSS